MNGDGFSIVLGLFAFGCFMLWHAFRRRQKVQKIEDTPRSKAESAPQGYVEVEGFAWPRRETVKGASGDELIYYALKVQRLESRGSGKNRTTEWVTKFTYRFAEPFYLVDATGLILIDVRDGEVDIGDERERRWPRLSQEEKDAVVGFTQGRMILGFPPPSFFFGLFASNFRIVESEISVGSPVYANGDFRTIHEETPTVLLAGLTEFHSRVFDSQARGVRNIGHFLDKNRNGKVSAEEARRGYAFAARQTRMKAQSAPGAERAFSEFGKLGSSASHALLLADLHQGHLVKRQWGFIWVQFLVGAGAVALAAVLVTQL